MALERHACLQAELKVGGRNAKVGLAVLIHNLSASEIVFRFGVEGGKGFVSAAGVSACGSDFAVRVW